MSANRSAAALLGFLDYLGQKGLIPSSTASSRKATANKVLAILSEEEAGDVLALDLDHLMQRFHNLNAQQYTPESLQTYKSRMKTALEDFRSYSENPLAFKPVGQGKSKPKTNGDKGAAQKKAVGVSAGQPAAAPAAHSVPIGAPPAGVVVLPIPLRANLTVQVAGIPHDLTRAEAQKIANIILAHALVE